MLGPRATDCGLVVRFDITCSILGALPPFTILTLPDKPEELSREETFVKACWLRARKDKITVLKE